ncbi:MAG: dienelactone hydrolase family protein [Burkholderiales bacterium]|nr:MAG: dienelactone hydrolase family protein [Burkholderiales bacterium]
MPERQLWLEFPPISHSAPPRLLAFLHGAGSSPEALAPVALSWHLKFPGATVAVLQGTRRTRCMRGRDWFDPMAVDAERRRCVDAAVGLAAERLAAAQHTAGLDGARTVMIGFSQGATMALELARAHPELAAIVVSYAGRLARPVGRNERVWPTIHLIHGEFDSIVPAVHAQQAFRGLKAAGADVTLDIAADTAHTIGQQLVNLGTLRVMQTVFRGRRRGARESALH